MRIICILAFSFSLYRCVPEYDVLIRNVQIHDGLGNDVFPSDIAIRKDKITKIGPNLRGTAKKTIEAEGKFAAPGFIDVHAHLEPLYLYPDAKSHIMQGVTTAIGGPDGSSPFPLGSYLDTLEIQGVGMNVGYLIGHNTIRNHVMGLINRAPSNAELQTMKEFVAQAIQEGAFGISTGLKYLPGAFAKTDEIIEISKIASQYGGIYTSHLREEGLGLLEGVEEAITIARESDIPVILTHHKVIGEPMWGSSVQTLKMVDKAREDGLDVKLDQYPYTASHTWLGVVIPAWALEGNPYTNFAARCQDPELRDSIKKGITYNLINDRGGNDLRRIQFAKFDWKPELVGKTLHDWAISEGLEPTIENGAELIMEAQLHRGANCIYHVMHEEDVERIMQYPFTMIASDGRLTQLGIGHPHPRAYGTFPRVLGYYAREKNIISIPEAIRKMTSLPAQSIGLPDRGVIRENYFADITLFDANIIKDKANFKNPHQYPEGIFYVLINGRLIVDNGVFQDGVFPGKVLRKQAQSKNFK